MKPKTLFISILLAGLLILTGCATFFKSNGKNTKAEEKARTGVENVETKIVENAKDKMEEVAKLSYGVDYALNKEENPSKNVEAAKDLNTRVQSLTGAPTLEEVKNMRQLIDDLTSNLNSERERGQKSLEDKDLEIKRIQSNSALLVEAKDAEIRKYMKIAEDTAGKADIIQGKLNKMDSFFGLGEVF
jgi:chromosome segregation ATPase